MRVTVLIENETAPGHGELAAEAALSLYIELDHARLLFDSGSSGAFASNAAALGVDLGRVDAAVLSHHHYDHSGGFAAFFELNSTAPLHLRPTIEPHRFRMLAVIRRDIGVDEQLLTAHADRLRPLTTASEILPGVHLLSEFGTRFPRPRSNDQLYTVRDGHLVHDDFEHELTMVVVEDDGMTVVTGCSHRGILNMVEAAVERFPGLPVKAVLGGFHLSRPPFANSMAQRREQVEEIARQLLALAPGRVYTGHCTGRKAYGVLESVMGDTLAPMHTGATIEI